jgi:dTDP-4-dehydrorhamnose 3,5-epimerase
MKFDLNIKTSDIFSDIKIFEASSFCDHRGDIWTIWERENILPDGLEFRMSKFAKSTRDVLRGLHGDFETWKYITCPYGEVYFVIVDIRKDSDTYLKWESHILNDKNHIGVLVPPGFVNGHLCITKECLFHYMMSYTEKYVDVEYQNVVKWNDERIGISWPINNPILAQRDK